MKRLGTIAGVVAVLAVTWGVAFGVDQPQPAGDTDAALPPCVASTFPADRATDVDPALTEIAVTFDREMTTEQAWSWITHPRLGAYPGYRNSKAPRFERDGRTCVLPVKLKPNTVYAVGVNSFRHAGFRDKNNRVAVPHVWVFKTKAAE